MAIASLHCLLHARVSSIDTAAVQKRMQAFPPNPHPSSICNMEELEMKAADLRGLNPAPVTPFTREGEVDYAAIQRLGSWLGSIPASEASSFSVTRAREPFSQPTNRLPSSRASSKRWTGRFRSSPASLSKAPKWPRWRRSAPSRPVLAPASCIRPTAGCGSATRRVRRRIATARSLRRAACR